MSSESSPLVGKVALVTGGNRGIGRAVALALAEAGAAVAVNYRRHEQEAEHVAEQIETAGGKAVALRADVSQADQVAELVRRCNESLGAVDVLVNNAGMTRPQALEEITVADWNELLAVNLTSAFLVTQQVLPAMRKRRWGRIINVSSVAAQLGGVVGPHYAASKAGLHGLTHSYAALLARHGITCNAIAPALIETAMTDTNPAAKPDLIPVGRFGMPAEVARVVLMLATNSYVTGQTINVNGGWYMS